MRLRKYLTAVLVGMASLGVVLPRTTFAATTGSASASVDAVRDVALRDGGRLTGQVLDTDGAPLANTTVAVAAQGHVIASSLTDAGGYFAIPELRAGVYEVATSQSVTVCRLWAPGTAPPAAQADALVIHTDTVMRGGDGACEASPYCASRPGVIRVLSNPWVLGGIVAAAIAIPLALKDDAS